MSSQNQQHETTVWLWPTGLFPRRVVYYLRAKNITSSMLHEKNIRLIPIFLDKDAPTPDLVPHPGLEARPTGTSVPALRITYADGTIFWIYESNAMMEYFEEVFSVANGYSDVRGATIPQRARTRDILSLLSDAVTWSNVALVHSHPNTVSWSGLTEDEMSESAAKHARGKFHMLLSRLEARIQGDVVGNKSESLSGDGANVTLADLCIMAQVEYMQEMYGLDWVAEHGVLRVWYDRSKGQSWVVGRSALQDVERTGEWTGVLDI